MQRQRIGIAALLLACGLTACHTPTPTPTVSVFGLWPEEPPLRCGPFNACTDGNCYAWPQLDSTQPVLRWESFPRPGDLAADTNGFFAQFQSVTYDLRVWGARSENELPDELVYSRDALPQPVHRLETPLSRGCWYFWTVRARFELNGQTRVTEWSFIMSPESAPGSPVRRDSHNYPDARYFRFHIR